MPARVVVVDDEALRNAVRRALRLEGYDVELAGDGEEALDHLAGLKADVVVLDVLMPVLDGIMRFPAVDARSPELEFTCDSRI